MKKHAEVWTQEGRHYDLQIRGVIALTLGEYMSVCCVGVGLLCLAVSIVVELTWDRGRCEWTKRGEGSEADE